MIMKIYINLCFLVIIILFCDTCASENVKKSVEDNRDDDMAEDGKDESMEISPDNENINITFCHRRKNSQMHEVQAASQNQYPFIVAIMSAHNEYICAGSIVSNGMILTSAHCTESANYVLVNTTTTKKNGSSIVLHITRNENFPTHSGDNKDVAILYTEKLNNTIASKIKVMNNTKIEGVYELEAVGFGLNAQVGQTKELQSVGLEAEQGGEVSSAFLNCIDTKVPACFKDKGGPVIIGDELIGVIVKGEDECTSQMSSTYAANKHMIDFLNAFSFKAWLQDKIAANEGKAEELLETYPAKPIAREVTHVRLTAAGNSLLQNTCYILIIAHNFLLRFL